MGPRLSRRLSIVGAVIVLVAGLMPAATAQPAQAADPPVLGGQLFSTGLPVEVEVKPASAGFTSELWLFSPGPARRLATNRDVGAVIQVGTFPGGVELIFGIVVLGTGNTFKMGPGDRNPDGIPHAVVTFLEAGKAQVGFEDLFGGGDRDYNDNVFEFRGGIVPEPPKGPTADAGPDQSVVEGSVVTLDGTGSTDPDTQNLTYHWQPVGQSGPPIALSSSSAPKPAFQTTDDGTYRFELTVSDGSESDTDEVVVTVTNAVPVLSAQADPAYAGGVALVTTSFTDAGILDTHSGSIDWGDGSSATPVPAAAQGSGWGTVVGSHVYANPGSFTVRITVTDDDGGAATTTVAGLQVLVPVALWANSNSTDAAMESTSGKVTVTGLTHSNDDLRLRGDVKTFHGPVEYVRTLDIGGGGAVFDQTPVPTAVMPFPFRYDVAAYRPGGAAAQSAGTAYHDMSSACGSNGLWHVNGSTLSSGIYYATCSIQINGNPIGGTITVVAEKDITVAGTGAFFDPYTDGLLFLSGSTSTNAIRVDTSNSSFLGYFFAEKGRIVLNGAGNRFYCGILGDRIDIAARDLVVRGSGCGRPAHTNAPPTIVPSLTLDVSANLADALPNETLRHTAVVTNAGATLVVPGVVGLENLATSGSPATVTGHDLHLEYLAVADGLWHPLPGTVTFDIRPNAYAGVTYPAGGDPIDGTQFGPGTLASWGYAAVVRLDPAGTALLLDPARTAAIRAISSFEVSPATAPVRRLFRFGDDLAAQARALGATATNVNVTIIPPAGDATSFAAPTTPALASLVPGASATVALDSTVPAPAARTADELDAAYLARLRAFDGTPLTGVAFARGSATIGPILAPADAATTTRHLPVVSIDKTGPADAESGTTAAYGLALQNVGSAEARSIAVTDAIAGGPSLSVTGAPATLAAGATGSASASYAIPTSAASQTLDNVGTVRWSDAAGGTYGPLNDHATTRVITPRKLAVTKAGFLTTAADGSQSIDYELAITNLGDQAVTNAVLTDTPDALTTIESGSVTTTVGTVTRGNEAGATGIEIAIGTIPGRSTAVVAFSVTVGTVPEGVVSVTNQATVTSTGLAPVPSDDPEAPGVADPTITPVGPTAGEGGGGGGGGAAKPAIGSPTPPDGTVVTEPTTLSFSIAPPEGQAIASWKITATRAGTTGSVTLGSATGLATGQTASAPLALTAVPLEALAETGDPVTATAPFDPTKLPNGTYLITVSSTASGGGTQAATTSLIVDGNLKLGRYQTTYQDLNVGVGGLPMQVLRTYDSFDKSVGDFGVGWRVEIANFRVSVNKPLGLGGWTRQPVNCGLIFCSLRYSSTTPHVATVVWPDGHQEIFDFQPQDGSTFFAPLTAGGFRGRPNTTSKLEVEGDNSLMYLGDGNLYGGAFGSGGVFDPHRFRLTAKDGTEYVLDRASGLVSARDRNGNTLTVSPTGVTSSLGRSIAFTRDPQGRITQVTGPSDETLTYQYGPTGDLVAFTDELTRTFRFEYDADHNLRLSRDPTNQPFRTITYQDGRLASITDGENNTTLFSSDVGTRRDVITDPTGLLTTVVTYDDRGNIIQTDRTFGGRTLTTRATFDELDRPTTETDPLNHTIGFEWDARGNLTKATDAEDRSWSFGYGASSLLETITAPDQTVALRLGYDPFGNLVSEKRADADPIQFTYTNGQLTSVSDGTGHTIGIVPTPEGQVGSVTTADNRTRSFTYDDSGRVKTITEPDTGVTRFTYDDAGNLLTATDALNRVRTYGYDAFHHLVTERDPSNRTTTYTYDDAGRVTSRLDRNNQTVSYEYDAAGRLTKKTLPGSVITSHAYDPLGRPTSMTGPDGRVEFTWDDASRLVGQRMRGTATSVQPDVSLALGYDDSDLRTSVAGPWGTTGFDYDVRGRLDSVERPGGGSFSFGYDDLDRVISIARPNGVNDVLAWTDTDQLLSRTSTRGATVLAKSDYGYGDGFLRTSMTDVAGTHSYGYDAMGRLATASHPAGSGIANESYTYNQAADRTSWPGSPASSVVFTADRLTRDGTYDYVYDNEGNLVRRTERATSRVTIYDWNADHLLTAIHHPDGTTSRYRYDPLGRRTEIDDAGQVRRFVWDGGNVVAEYDGANTLLTSYVVTEQPGEVLGAKRGSTWETYLQDGLGSLVAVVDESGSVSRRLAYDAYGRPVSTASNERYAFTGHQYDARSGLYYARARYYDPGVGRFISEDPVPALNAYGYSSCNPTNLVDSSGLQVAVERGLLSRIQQGISEALASEVESFVCQELVKAAILGLGGGPNVLGQMGEQALGDALGPNGLPQQDLGARRPDFRTSLFDYAESKNATRISGRSVQQVIDTGAMVTANGGQYVVVTRASTATKLLESTGRLGRFIRGTPGVFLVGCLPG